MSDEIQPPPDPRETETPGVTIIWLLVAFVPSFLAIPRIRNPSSFVGEWLWLLGGGCCVLSAFGVLRGVKSLGMRIFLGLLLAGFFFVLNIFIVILIGCSGMGRIAP